MTPPSIAILTNERDFAADAVVNELSQRGALVQRLNIERATTQSVGEWQIEANGAPDVVWWRQFEIDTAPESLRDADDLLVDRAQWRTWLSTLRTPATRWMNDLWAARKAENKVEQLRAASAVGFQVPKTVVTNDRATAARFRSEVGSAVIKTLSAGYFALSEDRSFVFTEELDDAVLDSVELWNEVPVIVQQNLNGALDARVVSFGNRVFCATCASRGLDWRKTPFDPELWSAWEPPTGLTRLCEEYRRTLALEYAAFDFMIDGDDVYFLEANQAGEWRFLERAVGLPISAAVADRLIAMGPGGD